jgi:hypothetical protein
VRCLLLLCTVFFCATNLHAQHQESTLVDRLLRPNMELQNDAQSKKYAAANSAGVERRGTVGTFYLQPNRSEKSFAGTADYSTREFSSHSFNSGTGTVATAQNRSASKSASDVNSSVHDIRPAYDAQNAVAGRNYAEQRPFTEKGKSQKSLDRQNSPLTIDQVRELLNKNK